MEESKIYKRITLNSAHERNIAQLTPSQNTAVQNILNRFRTYFIDKHSS